MEIGFQSSACCLDGVGGQVSHILINERNWKITYLVVEEGGAGGDDWMVPLRFVASSSPAEVRLNCSLAQLHHFEHFTQAEAEPEKSFAQTGPLLVPATGSVYEAVLLLAKDGHIPEGYLSLDWGSEVRAADNGLAGRVHAVRCETLHHMLSALVLRQGRLWSKKQVAVPAHNIASIEPGQVTLNLDRCQIADLPALQLRGV